MDLLVPDWCKGVNQYSGWYLVDNLSHGPRDTRETSRFPEIPNVLLVGQTGHFLTGFRYQSQKKMQNLCFPEFPCS